MCFQRKSCKLHFGCSPLLLLKLSQWPQPLSQETSRSRGSPFSSLGAPSSVESLQAAQTGAAKPKPGAVQVSQEPGQDVKIQSVGQGQSQKGGPQGETPGPSRAGQEWTGDHIQVLEPLCGQLRLWFLPGLLWKARVWFRGAWLHSVSTANPWAQPVVLPSLPYIFLLSHGDWAKSSTGPQSKHLLTPLALRESVVISGCH